MAAYINGEWQSNGNRRLEVVSPADGEQIACYPFKGSHSLDAIQSARRAFAPWARLGLEGRTPYLRRLQVALAKRKEEIAKQISIETGKPLWES